MKLSSNPGSTMKNKTGGWRTFIPKTDYSKCIGCGLCSKVCPEGVVEMEKDNTKEGKAKNRKMKPTTDYDFCKGCGVCAEECPVKAIKMELDKK